MKITGILLIARDLLLTTLSVYMGFVGTQAANTDVYTLTCKVYKPNSEVYTSESDVYELSSDIEVVATSTERTGIELVLTEDTISLDGDIEIAEEAEIIFQSIEVKAYYDDGQVVEDIINRDFVTVTTTDSNAIYSDGVIVTAIVGLGTDDDRVIYVLDAETGLEDEGSISVEYEVEEAEDTKSTSSSSNSSSSNKNTTSKTIDWETYKASWQANYAINSDYIGKIVFASGLISEHFVQYYDASNLNQGYYQYVRLNWKTLSYDYEGTVFIDSYANIASSMNFVLYGHYVYGTNHKFTPLAKLLSASNYSANSIFYLYLEDEIRVYQIAHVYLAQLYSSNGTDYNMVAAGMNFMKTSWTEAELTYYLEQVSLIEQYDTGVEIKYGDKFITLQTCVANRDDQLEIVIAKQISTIKYGTDTSLLIDLSK